MKTLEVTGLSVFRSGKALLMDLSFTLNEGDWLAIVGPNGAGKSTLMKALCGEWQAEGSIRLDGRSLASMSPRERSREIGLMDQTAFGQFAFTVEEVVRMGRYPYRRGLLHVGDPGEDEAVARALTQTGLTALKDRSVLTLSGGERQRVALAQTLCQHPPLLLLDEPVNHLDLSYQQSLYRLADEWRRVPGQAVVTVLHDLSAARRFATHALLLCGGRALAFGPAADALTDSALQAAWGVDVAGWIREMCGVWK